MKKEYDLKKMKSVNHPTVDPKKSKILTSVRIDMDVMVWLKEQSDKEGIPYQTLMNSLLRKVMQGSGESASLTREAIREMIREQVKEEMKKKKAI